MLKDRFGVYSSIVICIVLRLKWSIASRSFDRGSERDVHLLSYWRPHSCTRYTGRLNAEKMRGRWNEGRFGRIMRRSCQDRIESTGKITLTSWATVFFASVPRSFLPLPPPPSTLTPRSKRPEVTARSLAHIEFSVNLQADYPHPRANPDSYVSWPSKLYDIMLSALLLQHSSNVLGGTCRTRLLRLSHAENMGSGLTLMNPERSSRAGIFGGIHQQER